MFMYDAFISYRHGEADQSFADELDRRLQACGFSIAIDRRDFSPNRHFLEEIERCITTARYTMLVISARYFESGNTTKEAVISSVLSMSDRRDRVVPLIIEPVTMPNWLYGITGIDFANDNASNDPYERMIEMLYAQDVSEEPVARGRIKPVSKRRARSMLENGVFALSGAALGILLGEYISRNTADAMDNHSVGEEVDADDSGLSDFISDIFG